MCHKSGADLGFFRGGGGGVCPPPPRSPPKSAPATNNHQTGLSDISYQNPFSRDSNDIKKLSKKLAVSRKNRFEILDFSFDRIKWR